MRKQALPLIAATVSLLVATAAPAITANYAKQLERPAHPGQRVARLRHQ